MVSKVTTELINFYVVAERSVFFCKIEKFYLKSVLKMLAWVINMLLNQHRRINKGYFIMINL